MKLDFYSQITCPNHSSPTFRLSTVSFQEKASLRETTAKQGKARGNNIGQSPPIESGQDNLIGKEVQRLGNESKTYPLPLLESHKKHQADGYSVSTKDLMQILAGHLLDTSVSVSPDESFLVDSLGCGLMSSIPSYSYRPSFPHSMKGMEGESMGRGHLESFVKI